MQEEAAGVRVASVKQMIYMLPYAAHPEGHPCSMLPYPRMSPFIFPLMLKSWSPGDHSTKSKLAI